MFEFLRRLLNFFRRKEPEPVLDYDRVLDAVHKVDVDRVVRQERVRQARASRPIGSYTGPGMRKLRRTGRSARHHEKSMGVDHSLSMRDVARSRRPCKNRGRR